MARLISLFLLVMLLNSTEAASQLHLRPVIDTAVNKISMTVLPQNFYKHSLGFFCKKEVQLQKLTGVQFFFRLGSKNYVDRLEYPKLPVYIGRVPGSWNMDISGCFDLRDH
jgi:hypothetical protein